MHLRIAGADFFRDEVVLVDVETGCLDNLVLSFAAGGLEISVSSMGAITSDLEAPTSIFDASVLEFGTKSKCRCSGESSQGVVPILPTGYTHWIFFEE